MNNKTKKIVNAAVVFAVVLALAMPGSAAFANRDIAESDQLELLEPEGNVVELAGSVGAELFGQHAIVVPSIDMSDQVLNFNVSETGSGTYSVNETLRINISVQGNSSGQYLLGRHLTVFVMMYRGDMPLISGLLGQLFIGKPLTIKRINVLSDDEKYIDIPIQYETTKESERIIMHIFAVGTAFGKILDAECPPLFVYKRISTEFQYTAQWLDVTAPVTLCFLEGELLNGTYITDVTASLYPEDGGSGVDYSMYRYSYCCNGISMQTQWGPYTDPVTFSGDGNYSIDYYSVDNAGNQEEEITNNFSIQHM